MNGPGRAWPLAAALALLAAVGGCEPELKVGTWVCSTETDAAIPDKTDPVALPWSSGFENRFCDYTEVAGYCYADPRATYEIVTSPVHSGKYAAAFRVDTDDSEAEQARCVRQGELPAEAYYGAWYFIPEQFRNTGLWNLIHFQGGETTGLHGLWDVSLVSVPGGGLQPIVFDFLRGLVRRPSTPVTIPIGEWFHIQFYLKRARTATGEVALYVDGSKLLEASNIITDDSDYGQWYVGNLADSLMPSNSTLYVDDVTIAPTL